MEQQNKNAIKHIIAFIGALSAFLLAYFFGSCTAGVTLGRANRIEQTVTNTADSVSLTTSFIPSK